LPPATHHYQLIVEAFADAVLNNQSVPLPPQDSINNAKVLDSWAQSIREGCEISL
jgi:hypothetical protein